MSSIIEFDGAKLIEKSLGAMPDQVDRAVRFAIKKTIKTTAKNIEKDIVNEYRLPSSFKEKRVKSSSRGLKGDVWVGGYSIAAWKLGTQRQTKKGVKAGRYLFRGGFMATMDNKHTHGFRRKKTTTRYTANRPRTSIPNLGIEHLKIELPKIEKIVRRHEIAAQKELETLFAQELQSLQQGNVLR